MKMITKSVLAALALATAPIAFAPAASAQVAYSDRDAMLGLSGAYKAADAAIKAANKPLLDQIDARGRVIDADLNMLRVKLEADYRANPKNPTLQSQADAIQQKQEAGRAEVAKMYEPVDRAYAYVEEQIFAKLPVAVRQAMTKKKVTLLLKRDAVLQDTAGMNLTQDIVNELNVVLPSVSITPPAGWQPGGQQAAAPGAAPTAGTAPAPAAAPATKPKKNEGR